MQCASPPCLYSVSALFAVARGRDTVRGGVFFVCVGGGLRGGSLRASARVRVFNFNYELRLGVLWGNGVILWRGGGEGAAAPCDPCPTLYK